jgi:hypothetical protein
MIAPEAPDLNEESNATMKAIADKSGLPSEEEHDDGI